MTEVEMASSMGSLLLSTGFPVASRIGIRLLSETRSELEYLRKYQPIYTDTEMTEGGNLTISLELPFFGSENPQTRQ